MHLIASRMLAGVFFLILCDLHIGKCMSRTLHKNGAVQQL